MNWRDAHSVSVLGIVSRPVGARQEAGFVSPVVAGGQRNFEASSQHDTGCAGGERHWQAVDAPVTLPSRATG